MELEIGDIVNAKAYSDHKLKVIKKERYFKGYMYDFEVIESNNPLNTTGDILVGIKLDVFKYIRKENFKPIYTPLSKFINKIYVKEKKNYGKCKKTKETKNIIRAY